MCILCASLERAAGPIRSETVPKHVARSSVHGSNLPERGALRASTHTVCVSRQDPSSFIFLYFEKQNSERGQLTKFGRAFFVRVEFWVACP